MKKPKAEQVLTTANIAKMSDAAGIALHGERLVQTTDLASRFRGSVDVIRAYLCERQEADSKAEKL